MTEGKELKRFAEKNAWLLLAMIIGLLLMYIGSGDRNKKSESVTTVYEQRLCQTLSRMEGVGEVYVLLSEKPGRDQGYSGAAVVCAGGGDPDVRLRVTLVVQTFTSLGSDKIIVQKMIS